MGTGHRRAMLIGRAEERNRIDLLIEQGRDGASAALILHGDPGIGKSTLVDYAVAQAEGFTVLRVQPLEAEAELPFAGLSFLSGRCCRCSTGSRGRRRLHSRRRWRSGRPRQVDRFAVAAATLSILAAGAEEAPLLVAVDDAQWLDGPSREALLFAARRARQGGRRGRGRGTRRPWLEAAGIERLEVTGLPEGDARTLIDASKRDRRHQGARKGHRRHRRQPARDPHGARRR